MNTKGGKVMFSAGWRWAGGRGGCFGGGRTEQNTPRGRGRDPCKVPLVMPNLQNFIVGAPACLIIRRLPPHPSCTQRVCVCWPVFGRACVCVREMVAAGRRMRLADVLFLIISEHSLQTFIDRPRVHQSFALSSSRSSGGPVSHLTTPGLILP